MTQAVEADHHDRLSLIALVDGEVVGQAMYARLASDDGAEVAIVVYDGWQWLSPPVPKPAPPGWAAYWGLLFPCGKV